MAYRNNRPATTTLFMGGHPTTRSQAYNRCLTTGQDVTLVDYGADPVVKYSRVDGKVLVKEAHAKGWAVSTPEGFARKGKGKKVVATAPKRKNSKPRREVVGYSVKGLPVATQPNKGKFLQWVRQARASAEGRCKLAVAGALVPYGVKAVCHYKDGGQMEFLAM